VAIATSCGVVVALAAVGPFLVVAALAVVLAAVGAAMVAERRGQLPMVAHLVLLATAFTQPMSGVDIGPFGLGDYLLALAVGLYILMALRAPTPPSPYWRVFRPLILGICIIAVGGVAGALAEPNTPFIYSANGVSADISGLGGNIAALLRLLIGSLGPFALFLLARPDRRVLKQIVTAFVAGGLVSALVGLLLPGFRQGPRVMGLTPHPVHFGTLSVFAIGCALALLLGSQRRLRLLPLVVLPILVAGLLESGSRAALGGLVALCLLLGPLTRRRSVMAGALLGAASLGLVLSLGLVRFEGENALGRALNPESRSALASDEARTELRDRALDRWR
jgi:hypothetical protein